jgi:D-aspartate ligase
MNNTPVVVLNMFNHVGVGVVRSLGRLGVPVYGVHAEARSASSASRYCRRTFRWDIRQAAGEDSVSYLQRVAIELGRRPILIPTEDISCLFVADNSEALREHFDLPSQPAGLTRSLSSKHGMYLLCKKHGVPTPETHFPRSRDEVEAFAATATFPVVMKNVDTPIFEDHYPERAGAGKAIVRDRAELLETYERSLRTSAGHVLLQEYIPGGAESVWMFNGYYDSRADCLVAFSGRKLRQYPPYIGQTSLGLCTWNDTVVATTKRFLKALGYRGIVDMEYQYDARDGRYKLLDVNPRIGAAFRLFVGTNGMDVARALYLDLTGQPVPSAAPREGRKWLVENYDLVSSAKYGRDRRLTLRGWLRSFADVEETAWLALDDPAPFGMMCWKSLHYGAKRLLGRRHPTPLWWAGDPPDEEVVARDEARAA